MSTLTDDVKVAEHKILEVGKLQSILAETLALQADVIDTIHDDVEEASSNVEAGNREMQEVIRTNIDFYLGVFMLFVFLSCCLLFLDWYRS
jgi:t-SNARE complex subunit (syntaxin)